MEQATPLRPRPAAPPRYGLVVSSLPGSVDDTAHWEAGFSFNPEGCNLGEAVDRCLPGSLQIADNPPTVTNLPVALWAGDRCSPWEITRDWQGRARRQLAAAGPTQLAREFWRGDVAQAGGYPNRYLASSDALTLTSGPVSLLDGLSCLEEGIADQGRGERGMIHATLAAVTAWQAGGALRREGNLLLTVMDTIIVPDAGYDGSAPDGSPAVAGSVWAYGTTMVDVRRGSVYIVPDGDPTNQPNISRQGVDPRSNTIEYYAWQAGAASWDGCAHVAVELNLTHCGLLGS